MMPKNYDVYLLIDPRCGRVFYVGCSGSLPQRTDNHFSLQFPTTKGVISEIKDAGMLPVVAVVHFKKNRDFALREEKKLIQLFQRAVVNKLCNPAACSEAS